jgi:hypothetical protein
MIQPSWYLGATLEAAEARLDELSAQPAAISVNSSVSTDPHLVQTRRLSDIMETAVESHRTQAAVGSAASGKGSGGKTPDNTSPDAWVTGSKVVPQSAQTWLKQQFGVQE